jgi:hypothetical protein
MAELIPWNQMLQMLLTLNFMGNFFSPSYSMVADVPKGGSTSK